MAKKRIAIVTGGDVAERGVSLESARTVFNHLDSEKYERFIIELNGTEFVEQVRGVTLDKNDFSLRRDGEGLRFDLVYLMLHGHPAEDGRLQGYFELIGLPCTGCDVFCSALTFDKQATKDYLRTYGVPMAESRLFFKGRPHELEPLQELGLPLFVKPNKNGSSYGVTKVKQFDQLPEAMDQAFRYDNEVVVEQFLDGREFSNGVFRRKGRIEVLPVTEIKPFGDFFDYSAKYEKQSEEITPAVLEETLAQQVRAQTERLYELLGCRGACRMDYILVEDVFYFLEANTIPGMAETSILPQQAIAHGLSISELLDLVIEEALDG